MSTIVFRAPSEIRNEFIFRTRTTRFTINGQKKLDFPCIVMYHRVSQIPVAYPSFEKYLFEMNKVEEMGNTTLKKKAIHLCSFLNYILWNTSCDGIADITLQDIRGFFLDYREVSEGCPRDPREWGRGITDVIKFVLSYVIYNDGMTFRVAPEDLVSPVRVSRKGGKYSIIVDKANKLYVKPPKKLHRKYRLLLHGHLALLLYEAKKHDPMILLGIMLQAYAGIREGEVVNCTQSNIHRIYGGFGRISKVEVDLKRSAEFAVSHTEKTEFGSIKILRRQEVYPDFIDDIVSALDEHERYLHTFGYPTSGENALFFNKRKSPMTVSTYTGRVKKLFYEHFLPDLKKVCEAQGTWAENAPYIEAYEREYPGAHMFRHWYTMYLIQYTTLEPEEVSHWRGDASIDSMKEYIHENQEFISVFRDAVFSFQKDLLEAIL